MNLLKMLNFIILFFLQITSVSYIFGFSPEKARFSIKFKDDIIPYRVFGLFLLPEEEVILEIQDPDEKSEYTMNSTVENIKQIDIRKWKFKLPKEKGLYHIKINDHQLIDSINLNIFIVIPFKELKGEYLNDYRIGNYPLIPSNLIHTYKKTVGFIEVTEENKETYISPHFKVGQFLCKQKSNFPKYIVLKERLLLKLELILEKVNGMGLYCETFNIMSGYRTPYYNKLIGNVKYSRHLWGGAADIFIDENPKDKMMDDLNKDGKIDYKDAAVLYDIIDNMYGKPWYKPFIGGLGRYKKKYNHGPFVHVDVRGFRARWGD
jgi:hypothetical protein